MLERKKEDMKQRIVYNLHLWIDAFISLIYLVLSIFVKRKNDRIAFGSWVGKRFQDNSKYLVEYILEKHSSYTCYWVGDPIIKGDIANVNGLIYLKRNSIKANLVLLTCKYMFTTQSVMNDISNKNVFRKATLCYLHHGLPIKKIGLDTISSTTSKGGFYRTKVMPFLNKLSGRQVIYDYYATSSPYHESVNLTAYKNWGFSMNKSLACGTPRNDMLINYDVNSVMYLKEKYVSKFSISSDSKIVLYLPTFRRKKENSFSFSNIGLNNRDEIERVLKSNNSVLIEKSHFRGGIIDYSQEDSYLKFADDSDNVQELLLIADILISDYSGAFLDYVLLDRPIIHYVYDYIDYKNSDTGLYCDINDFCAGYIAYSYSELINFLERAFKFPDENRSLRSNIRKKFMTYEKGKASNDIFVKVIEKKAKNE